MSFTSQRLTGGRALIQGTDVMGVTGQQVVSTVQWDELAQTKANQVATADFESEVEAFFAPILEAAERMGKKLEQPEDGLDFVVLQEGVEGVEAQPAHVVRLTHDSKILRIIEGSDHSRLVWVNDSLEILAPVPAGQEVIDVAVNEGPGPVEDGGIVVDEG